MISFRINKNKNGVSRLEIDNSYNTIYVKCDIDISDKKELIDGLIKDSKILSDIVSKSESDIVLDANDLKQKLSNSIDTLNKLLFKNKIETFMSIDSDEYTVHVTFKENIIEKIYATEFLKKSVTEYGYKNIKSYKTEGELK